MIDLEKIEMEIEMEKKKRNIWIDGMMGVVIGDALGMPVQFKSRQTVQMNPITKMEGYGTYNMPPGTWSDDSSMAIATLDSIYKKNGIDDLATAHL